MSDTWSTADLTHGPARLVAERLNTAQTVTLEDVTSALVNALNRIDQLETKLAKAERSASSAANVASCLANGILPD